MRCSSLVCAAVTARWISSTLRDAAVQQEQGVALVIEGWILFTVVLLLLLLDGKTPFEPLFDVDEDGKENVEDKSGPRLLWHPHRHRLRISSSSTGQGSCSDIYSVTAGATNTVEAGFRPINEGLIKG